jgi:dipeptidase D
MNEQIRELAPAALWNHFTDLNAIPRPSKQEERVIQFMKSFGESLGLPVFVDDVGNVVIKKPTTPGMEDRETIVIQSHMDMVHQKNADTEFDFDQQGIEMYVDGDWVKARGTTLGADNGIGVASIMSLLSSTTIPHPQLEALFTVDEETGMTGAISITDRLLTGKILLNLDTEDDDELTIGCAGGIDVTASGTYSSEDSPYKNAYRLSVKGLNGGHSGGEIHLGKGNSNKIMNRLLLTLTNNMDIRIATIDGGSLRNAIPRESVAIVVVADEHVANIEKAVQDYCTILKNEYQVTDPNLEITITTTEPPAKVLAADFQYKLLRAVYGCPNGIYRMSPNIKGLVQSSNNLARILVKDNSYTVMCLTRSSVDSEKEDLARAIAGIFELMGAHVIYSGGYPGWEPKPDAPIIKIMRELYEEHFNEPPHVNAVHAGLECGIIGTNYPDMQMISFGPNIYGAHSPDERVQISSVQKYWSYLLETLKRIPVRS